MKFSSFLLCLGKWMLVPVAFAGVGYFFVLPKLQADIDRLREKDSANLFDTNQAHNASEFKAPSLKIAVKKASFVSSKVSFDPERPVVRKPRKKKKAAKPEQSSVSVSAPTAPKPESPRQPVAPDRSDSGPETIPIRDGDGE